jgi:hypothetical protein
VLTRVNPTAPSKVLFYVIGNSSNLVLIFLRNQNRQNILNWVPSHCNIPGNERADSLAKSAANTLDSPQHPTTPSYLKRILKQTRHKLWQKAFENRASGAVYHRNPSLKSAPTYHWNRHTSRALLHFRTGHGFFASTRHTTVELSDQLCSCKSKETRDHILLHSHGITEHESNSSKPFNSPQMMLRCHRQLPLPEHFYTLSHQKNHYTIAGIPELKCLIQIKMVKIPTSKHSNWFGGLLKTIDILIVVAAL